LINSFDIKIPPNFLEGNSLQKEQKNLFHNSRRGFGVIAICSSHLQATKHNALASGVSTVLKKSVAEVSKGQSLHLSG
jgi:hypothetical protein